MAKTSQTDRAKSWLGRLAAADKVHEDWEKQYKVRDLEKWYLGHQWLDQSDSEREKYVINLIFPSMETKKPSLLFFRPQCVLTPRPSRADDMGSPIEQRAKLREDTVNTFAADPRVKFRHQTLLALHETFFRFGVVEVGYTADFIDNPRAGKPMLKDDESKESGEKVPMTGEDGMPVMEPGQVLQDEQLFVRRIPASQFRFPECGNNVLEWNDWYAYYEWVNLEDVKRNPNYKNTEKLKAGGKLKSEDKDYTKDDADKKGKVKLWKIFDLRAKCRYVLPANGEKFIQEKPLKFSPHAVLKFHDILDQGYPLPPVYNWLHPQREYNETREDMRTFRRGAYRRYLYADGKIDEPELIKLETGGDGVYARAAQTEGVIAEVPQGKLNQGVMASIPVTKEDFNNITAVSSEQRNSAEAETATQAQIKQMNSNIRESFSRFQVAEWLSDIFRIMLKTIEENMALPFWIQTSVDPEAMGAQQEAQNVAMTWQLIKSEMLGPLEYDVTVDVESLSPASAETKKREFMDVMANVFGNPSASMVLMFAPTLLKRLLDNMGMRSASMLSEVQQALAGMQMMMMQQQGGGGGGTPGGPQPGATPDQAGIANQLQQQMGGSIQ